MIIVLLACRQNEAEPVLPRLSCFRQLPVLALFVSARQLVSQPAPHSSRCRTYIDMSEELASCVFYTVSTTQLTHEIHRLAASMFSRPRGSTVSVSPLVLFTVCLFYAVQILQPGSLTPTRRVTGEHQPESSPYGRDEKRIIQLPELHRLLQVHRCQGRGLCPLQAVQACLQLALPQ